MTQVSITRDLPCSVDAFWASFLDSAFMTRAFETIGFSKYDILEVRDEARRVVRRADARPPVDAPAVVQKVLGPSFGYVEEGEFDRASQTWTWSANPSVLADRSRMAGRLLVEALGANRCRTRFEATIEVKLLGIGGLIESTGERSLRATWARFGDFCASAIPAARADHAPSA